MELVRKSDSTGGQDKLQQEQEKQQQEQKMENIEEEKHYFHVLAVDDSVIDRKLLERLLQVSSYQVTCVDSVDKALEYLGLLDNVGNNVTAASASSSAHQQYSRQQEGMKVNLIMTDYCMPGMSGYDLLKRVKGSSWKDVPVVIMSSENIPSRITMCLDGGAEEFLLKPLQLSDMEKLQPHLLKSLDHTCQKIDSSTNVNNNKSINNNTVIKRKALSPDTADRRPKMKELAVV